MHLTNGSRSTRHLGCITQSRIVGIICVQGKCCTYECTVTCGKAWRKFSLTKIADIERRCAVNKHVEIPNVKGSQQIQESRDITNL